jgi:hypothetical protein
MTDRSITTLAVADGWIFVYAREWLLGQPPVRGKELSSAQILIKFT